MFDRLRKRKDNLREEKRTISRVQRETERERQRLEREEKKIKEDIVKLFKKGQKDAVKTLSKSLMNNRQQQERLYKQRSQLSEVSTSMVVAKQTGKMAQSFGQVSSVLSKYNDSARVGDFMKTMNEYEKQNYTLSAKQEYMSDAIDSALDVDVQEESEEVLNAVLDELNLNYASRMEAVPKVVPKERQNAMLSERKAVEEGDNNIEDRLASLRTP
ncbi:Charged multivesicular body protein 2a homolog 2 [Galdieria sulphuraria]|uniref:Charged multivesicular body protein 2A n=1 Tax=Galdieria sulphuraria TaxID=130081 RepID=M2XI82_GALSU|nr:charged multivesicular body protein 2A [Galdieria sulphuraria]EME29797.1 charged multivesicular body protein 2A [Galdieria sulphuraria]GJD06785.1 Charged multivesicular body protein 2a homolog 2 [Galdieria sulphuraria]|eukprot:XP_005706317.1 charged multivesicular body protein 2A [Galdieria sulphuraria]